ncbi:hypothetical protein TSUD_368370 [Trifolium subterraneum]|uniref:S-locus glycoprotein domain-containing protein n=1 Tax=Trifolium subterraneum TaxID=3900 RepID=A0A2Z6LMC2_TRISU|nr:hypothetical protein TSUD_368370 [Trifolium subterraneum]
MALNSEQGKHGVLLLVLWLWLLTTSTSIHVKGETIDRFLKVGDTLGPFSSLCYKEGTYCMSFDQGPENIPTYLYIYGPQEKEDWVVWIANRNQPVERDSVVLLLDHSGLSDSVPAPGPFRLEWEPISKELVIKNRENIYWKSGELMNNNRFQYISGENFRIGTDIARADLCNGYNTNGGCQKWGESKILPICRNSGDTCFGHKTFYDNGTGCVFLLSTKGLNVASSGDYLFYILVKNTDHKEITVYKKGQNNKWIWISAGMGTALLIIALSILFQALRKRKYALREENADDRPTMSNVISMLTNKIKADVLPKKPAYYGRTRVFEEETFAEELGVDSTY